MKKKETMWNPGFIIILLVNFSHQMGQQMMNTLVPKYAYELGANAYQVGLIGTAFAVSALLIRPISSPAFDSFSKKKLLIASVAGIFVAFTSYALSRSYGMLIAARLLHGICVGCVAPLSLAIASDNLPDSVMGSGLGIFSLCQAVGQALGPNMGLSLSQAIGFPFTFAIGAAILFAGTVLACFIKEAPQAREPYRITLDKVVEKDSIHAAVLQFFVMLAYTCIASYLAIYGGVLGIENIGLYYTVYAIFLLVTRPVSGKLIDRLGFDKVLIFGIVCFAASFLIIGASRTLPGFLIAAVVNAFGYGVCYPTLQSMCMSSAPKNRRGAAANTLFLGADCGMMVGPFCAGILVDWLNKANMGEVKAYSTMFCVMTVPIFAGLAYYLIFRRRIQAKIASHAK